MVNIPVRFKRTAAAFNEVAKWSCGDESSGSEHSADLSDLLNSFYEREVIDQRKNETDDLDAIDDDDDDDDNDDSPALDLQDSLKNLLDCRNVAVKWTIHVEVEKALGDVLVASSSPDFKRRLMARLRDRGFDAGLCKSKWEKNGRCSSGDYEYIDINVSGCRYIVEVFLAGEFTIARPTNRYSSLLNFFPLIFVGKPDELKQVVRLMCSAIRNSMKSVQIHVPPWRRLAYLQAKWFGSYKRTVNEILSKKALNLGGDLDRSVGLEALPGIKFYCREIFSAKASGRIGNLSAALNGEEMLL